jgi:hypothetical protein
MLSGRATPDAQERIPCPKTPAHAQVASATGYWLLATGYWLLATGYWLLATGYWLLATCLLGRGPDRDPPVVPYGELHSGRSAVFRVN